ncbi:hypothetical protein Leryth_025702 [Lithospermum erythrorhizon]|nr:hypothetical protein Leryth_025702 [Lithospermum erythrorhizon]
MKEKRQTRLRMAMMHLICLQKMMSGQQILNQTQWTIIMLKIILQLEVEILRQITSMMKLLDTITASLLVIIMIHHRDFTAVQRLVSGIPTMKNRAPMRRFSRLHLLRND